MLTDLTEVERKLIDAARRGAELVCGTLDHDQLRASKDPDLQIRGEVLRELLLGRHGELDPRGVQVKCARITGKLDLQYVKTPQGLNLSKCVVDRRASFRYAHLPWLNLADTHLPTMDAVGIQVDGNMLLRRLVARNDGALDAVDLLDAQIGGGLYMEGAQLTSNTGRALRANRLKVGNSVFLSDNFTATSNARQGAIDMISAHIRSVLNLQGARLTNTTGPALTASRLKVEGSVFLGSSFTATGSGESGTINLVSAHIRSVLSLQGAELTNAAGPALSAGGLKVEGSAFLNDKFKATGTGESGTINLIGAHIGGQLELQGAQLTNKTGPALNAGRLKVDGSTFLSEKFKATGTGRSGTVSLIGAHIGGQLTLRGAQLVNPDGLLLTLQDARSGVVFLPHSLLCPRGHANQKCPDTNRQFDVDGFVYSDLANVHREWPQWLHLLRCHTRNYRPMPYQQLAAIRTAAGHDRDARRIFIAQQEDHRARGDIGGPLRRTTHRLWGALAGYGYRTGRTALALLIVLLLAGGMGWWAGHTETAPGRHAAEHPAKFTACSAVELIGLGIDRGLPLASTGVRAKCDLDTASVSGQWFTVAIWLLQAAVWALATLALAGYTGLVRKIR